MVLRVAVLIKDRCQPKKCNRECIRLCPPNRSGGKVIVMGAEGKPEISEAGCIGCGICVHRCPFDAIRIIGLPDELKEDLVHQYGLNGFRLFRLPCPQKGKALGIVGPNGIGKTTLLRILAGELVPNMGDWQDKADWDGALRKYRGTELHDYLKRLSRGGVRTSLKEQYVDALPERVKGSARAVVENAAGGDSGKMDEVVELLELEAALGRSMEELSGGELQRVAIAAAALKEADVYLFDEPSSYLDIRQRLNAARLIAKVAESAAVVLIEHDLAILDFLCENAHIMYGTEGAFGVLGHPRPVRTAINVYLEGYLKEENIRFRDRRIVFEEKAPKTEWSEEVLVTFGELRHEYPSFSLSVGGGVIHAGESVGVVGPNATGKTTFVKMLAGVLAPASGTVDRKVRVAYKPQYIKPEYDGTLESLYREALGNRMEAPFFTAEVEHPLSIKTLYGKEVKSLSGGELQRASLGLCLGQEADLYLIDEPSAYLDSNQRMEAARTIRRVVENLGKAALVVDHDVYFIDLVADTIMVFGGTPAKEGLGEGPFPMREGMNRFLKMASITFRRDADTKRPRINKEGSRLDREQRGAGEYYYRG